MGEAGVSPSGAAGLDAAASGEAEYWWLAGDGAHAEMARRGPVCFPVLLRMHRAGDIGDATLVWTAGLADWAPFDRVRRDEATPAASRATRKRVREDTHGNSQVGSGSGSQDRDRHLPPNGEYHFVDDDGTAYTWDPAAGCYAPAERGTPDPAGTGGAVAASQSYTMDEMTFGSTPTHPDASRGPRDVPGPGGGGAGSSGAASKPPGPTRDVHQGKLEAAIEREKERQRDAEEKEKTKTWFALAKNTSVYVSGLPDDAAVDEVAEFFAKCGVIKRDADNKPRVKIYADEDGIPKGDGLVTYLKVPSVDLACQILGGAHFRPGSHVLKVAPAKFEMKGDVYVKKKKTSSKAKHQVIHQEKALEWGGFDDAEKAEDVTVILKHMFTLSELDSSPSASGFLATLESDVRSECAGKCGPVAKVRAFPNHPDGVVSVRFKFPQAAAKCVSVMHDRWFAGRRIEADLFDGRTNYAVKRKKESEEEQRERLEAFSRELEG